MPNLPAKRAGGRAGGTSAGGPRGRRPPREDLWLLYSSREAGHKCALKSRQRACPFRPREVSSRGD
eukprot:2462550-Alexandrium_andersonii.AAC.1